MNSREQILSRLRQRLANGTPFPAVQPVAAHRPVVPLSDNTPAGLQASFCAEAEKAACVVHRAATAPAAIEKILALIDAEKAIACWDLAHIPIPGLAAALAEAGVDCLDQNVAAVRVGLTGVDAALAATGSLVLLSGAGRPRATSLLPPVHIAVVSTAQIVPDFESWFAAQNWARHEPSDPTAAAVREHSNIIVITGPSRTADIAMQLVLGMHGPQALHVVLIEAGPAQG